MPYWQNPRVGTAQVGFGGGVSPVKQQGSVTPGGVAVWYDEGILVAASGATGGLVSEAPSDGQLYVRDGAAQDWVPASFAGAGIAEAPPTGGPYGRDAGVWVPVLPVNGAVTSITAGTGLTGGTITASGTIALATPVSLANGGTGVSAGSATAALTALGGAPLNSAALTGTPTLVTPPAGTDDSNALATTAWVTSKLASATAGVSQITATTPLNASAATGNVALTLGTVPVASGGTGATTAAAGLAALGGAPLLSPPLTGIPTAPTAAVGTDTTQVATTAFVKAAIDAISAGGGLPTTGGSLANGSGATILTLDNAGGINLPQVNFRQANGTLTGPLTITSNVQLGMLQWQGWNGTAYGGGANIYAQAASGVTWNTGNMPTRLIFQTTRNNEANLRIAFQVGILGGVVVGSPAGSDRGPGSVNAENIYTSGTIYIQGTSLEDYIKAVVGI